MWIDEKGDRVIGGWWNSTEYFSYREKEILLAGDKGGVPISGIGFTDDDLKATVYLMANGELLKDYSPKNYPRLLRELSSLFEELTTFYYKLLHRSQRFRQLIGVSENEVLALFDKFYQNMAKVVEESDKAGRDSEFKILVLNALKRNSESLEVLTGEDEYISRTGIEKIREIAGRLEELRKQYEQKWFGRRGGVSE
ncbi:MAG: hypothetical protein ACK4TI_00075 [Nitrososphaerales archaeon]